MNFTPEFPHAVDRPRERHGRSRTREYFIWNNIVQRCTNSNHPDHWKYKGRLCERWLSFSNFYEDMGDSNGLTVERKDNEKGYYKENCVWANRTVQARNTRRNRLVEYNDVVAPLVVHCGGYGKRYKTVWARLNKGWPVELALEAA